MKARKIKTKLDAGNNGAEIGGWLDGKRTYIGIWDDDGCCGHIGGGKLYRLAKAIVRQFEEDKS